jgi:hypothetical protein
LVTGVGYVVGIDRFMSEARAITNFIGNSVATIVIACWEKEFDRARARKVLRGELPFEEGSILATPDISTTPVPSPTPVPSAEGATESENVPAFVSPPHVAFTTRVSERAKLAGMNVSSNSSGTGDLEVNPITPQAIIGSRDPDEDPSPEATPAG